MTRVTLFLSLAGLLILSASCSNNGSVRSAPASRGNHRVSPSEELKSLYDAHQWFDLNDKRRNNPEPALCGGATAAAFARASEAEELLHAVIAADPKSPEALQACDWLSHLHIQTGQFEKLAAIQQTLLQNFPASPEVRRKRSTVASLLHLPNQRTLRSGFATTRHDGGVFSPMTINEQPAVYFFDTGAGLSAMSESEARRLGMSIKDGGGKMGTSTGHQTSFLTAVAERFQWGDLQLRNVSFAVFPDSQEPWKDLPEGHRGLIGIPVLLAAQRIRWSQDGLLEIGAASPARTERRPNLCFDEDQLIAAITVQRREIWMRLDTGAVETEFWKGFTEAFPDLIRTAGRKQVKEVHGIGHAEEVESVALPVLEIVLGGMNVPLRPAIVLMNQPGPKRCWGNIGIDALKRASAFEIDFRTMTLALQAAQ
jgi:hypothetical protein